MDWYSIGLAALSGGFAALIASLIFGKTAKKTAYIIVVVILFVVFNLLSKQFILPEINAYKAKSDIESSFENVPAFASIKKYDPEIYKKLLLSLTEASDKGYSRQEAIDLVRTQLTGLVVSRLPHASDEAIISYLSVMVEEMGELQSQGEDLCFKFLFPQVAGGIDGQKLFSQKTQKKNLAALDEIIKTSNLKRPLPAEKDVMPFIEPVFVNLFQKYGDDISMIESPLASNIDKTKVCNITKNLYKQIIELPIEQAAPTLRWMFNQA